MKKTTIGLLPVDWTIKKIKDVCETTSGGTPSRSKKEYYEKGTIPWIKTGELNQKYIFETKEKITNLALQQSSAKLIPKNAVLMAMYGATIGKTSITKIEAATNQACCALITKEEIEPEFLYYVLTSNKDKITALGAGGAQPNISQQIIRELEIPFPSKGEQRRIVSVLSSIDESIKKTEAIIDQTKKIKVGIMQQLFTKGIDHTKFKQTEIGKIPDEWEIVTIEDCCEILDSRRVPLSKKVRENIQGEVPYYGATGVVDYINDFIFDEEIVLIGEDGDHFKKFREWSMTNIVREKSWVNNHAHVLKAKNSVTNEWIYRFLEHRDITPYLSIQGATRLKLTQQNLRKIKIAVPSKLEQKQVTMIIDNIEKKAQKELKRLIHLRDIRKGLMQSLLVGEVRVKMGKAKATQI
ncbi:restriction endonuclease subunit S [Priestia sp. P5]|uniref:restriction endonuclease subunit S n=1 Tax=Priestia sp. P5 TaxID=2917806 RepID=UPI0024075666|nr:restriction endonuclease subunit S [Priestia sp. P5]MDG0059007.1 restriction endonuclease subunit S [Priestia sp. P5]